MAKSKVVTLLKSGNRIVVNPTTPAISEILVPILMFKETRLLYGIEKKFARSNVETNMWECFALDHKQRIGTSWGFHHRIRKALKGHKFSQL